MFLCLAATSVLYGQKTLTLRECLSIARERSPLVQAATNRSRAAGLSLDELRTERLPQLSVGAAAVLSPASPGFGYDPAITDGGQVAAQVFLHQSLYDAGVRSLRASQLELDNEHARVDLRLSRRDLDFEVTRTFLDAFKAQRKAAILAESRQRLAEYLSVVRRLERGGSATQTDVLKTELQLSESEMGLRTARSEYNAARLSLAEVVGMEIDTTISVRATEEDLSSGINPGVLPDTLQPLELSGLELAQHRSVLDIEIAQRERIPVVSLVADVGYLSSGDNLRLPPPERYGAFGASVGVQLELPVFNWGATDLRIQQRQLEAENQRLGAEAVRRSLMAEYRRALVALADAEDRLRTVQANRQTATDHYLLITSRFVVGEVTSLEVLDAQQLLTDNSLAELDAASDIDLLRARLVQLTTR
jgi:outer membrane protein TolC